MLIAAVMGQCTAFWGFNIARPVSVLLGVMVEVSEWAVFADDPNASEWCGPAGYHASTVPRSPAGD